VKKIQSLKRVFRVAGETLTETLSHRREGEGENKKVPLSILLHGSAVVLPGQHDVMLPKQQGVLVTGAPGSGKSSLCLTLMLNHGARLVADDQVQVAEDPHVPGHLPADSAASGKTSTNTPPVSPLLLSAPARLRGWMEVCGLGLVAFEAPHPAAPLPAPCPLRLWVQLVPAAEIPRLPVPAGARSEPLATLHLSGVPLPPHMPIPDPLPRLLTRAVPMIRLPTRCPLNPLRIRLTLDSLQGGCKITHDLS
jgi:HPr kinase/phosphorylase